MKNILFVYSHDGRKTIIKAKYEKIINGINKTNCKIDILTTQKGFIFYKRLFNLWLIHLKYILLIIRKDYDIIFIRYDYEYLFLFITNIIFNTKCHIELNTKIDEEFACQGQYIKRFLSKLSIFLAARCCKRVHAVTPEIKKYYENTFLRSEVIYSPNFIVDEYFKKNNPIRNNPISLVFLGNIFQQWQGIYKFINKVIINNQWFKNNCEFHIIGKTDIAFKEFLEINKLDQKVIIHGFLEGQYKNNVLKLMNIGIGAMNMKITNLTQATPLKVGEYLYSGLPIIIGYDDPRLKGKLRFVLKIDINDESKKLHSIVNEFIKSVNKSPDIILEAHKYAKKNMVVNHYIENIMK